MPIRQSIWKVGDTPQPLAAALDDSTERIIGYLGSCGVSINVLFFQVFEHGEDKFFSRAWLIDPIQA